MKKILSCVLSALVLLLMLTACSARSDNSASSTAVAQDVKMENGSAGMSPEQAAVDKAAGEGDYGGETADTAMPADDRQIIRDADISMETTDFDTVSDSVKKLVAESKGYVSGSSFYNDKSGGRSANYTCRIPAENYDAFMNSIGGVGNILSVNENTQDVTGEYIDLEARLKSLKAQEARLLELMENASSLENLIAVQDQLTETQYQIDSYTSKLNSMKDLISYSTVTVNVSEVINYTPAESNFGEKITAAFKGMFTNLEDGSQNFVIGLIYALPFLIFAAALAVIVILLVRRSLRKAPTLPPSISDEKEIKK